MLSFLNQALFGGDDDERDHRNSSLDNGQQQPAWRDLTKFYQEHEQIIKKYESLDLFWFAKHDKNADLEEAIEGFASSANVIAEGLVRLANVHPVLGVAVSAYHSVLTILLPSAAGHKKVLLVMLQMQVMMCTMFQLRHVKYTIRTKTGAEKTPLQNLLLSIATDIVQYGDDLDQFMSRDIPLQLLMVNLFEKKVTQQTKTLVARRNELQSLLSDRSGLGIIRSRTNTTIAAIGHMVQQADPKLHNFIAHFFAKIRTPDEMEAIKLLDGIKTLPAASAGRANIYVQIYAVFFVRFMDGPQGSGYTAPILRKVVFEALSKKLETGASPSLGRFKKFIEILDRDSERELVSRQKAIQRMAHQLHVSVNLPVVVRMSALGGRTKSVDLGPCVDIEDVEMSYFWRTMQFGTTVDIDTFIASYHQYLTTDPESNSVNANPKWISEAISVKDNTSFSGSLYEPGSRTIPIAQAHKFALERPEGMSLASWMAYWSSGWRINTMAYRDQIHSIMYKMHEAADNVHLANTSFVTSYLNSLPFIYIGGLFQLIGPTPDLEESDELGRVAKSVAQTEEDKLNANLSDVSFIIQSPEEVGLICGFKRIETVILPLLLILLQRHLAVIEIAQRIPITETEMLVHIQSIYNIFRAFYRRKDELEAKFKQAQQEVESQLKTFAHGMFHSSFVSPPAGVRPDICDTLSTFRNADKPLSRLYTTRSAKANTLDVSILVKGPGKDCSYDDIDRSITSRCQTHQRTHELEGSWCAANTPRGIIRINIGPIVNDNTIEGNAESFVAAYKVTGRVEPSARETETMGSSSEKSEKRVSEKPTGYLDVYLKCERLVAEVNARPLIFKGRYDPHKEVFRGEWKKEFSDTGDTDLGLPDVMYSLISAPDSRFAYLLGRHESQPGESIVTGMVNPSWTLARRRWAFATEAVLSQVRVTMGSSKVFKRGMEERRKWVQVSVFEEGGNHEDDEVKDMPPGDVVDGQAFEMLELTVPAENARVYQALAEYLHLRRVYDIGAVCDSCKPSKLKIKHTRFSCITCRSRFGKGNSIDLCAYCLESPNPMEESAFVHLGSHSLIRTSGRLFHFDEFGMIRQARALSEDIKKYFRGISGLGDESGLTVQTTAPNSLKCACCDKEVTLPCYSCLTCSLHPVFCMDCDRKEESVRRDHPSFTIHTRKHLLLRISDSTSVDTDLSYET